MKKLLTLIFVTLFLFTSCKEEVKPKEVETPTDVEENTEVETPTEVEEIILPEPDENTKVIEIAFPKELIEKEYNENANVVKIPFPESFYKEEYTEPTLVIPEEFEWGEYVPFVRANDYQYERYNLPRYAILSDISPTFEEGEVLYSKLNEKFLEDFEGEWTKIEANPLGKDNIDKYNDFLRKSRITYIAPELNLIGRVRTFPSDSVWNSKYDIISKEGILKSFYKSDIDCYELTLGGDWGSYSQPIYAYNDKLLQHAISLNGEVFNQKSEKYFHLPVFFKHDQTIIDENDFTKIIINEYEYQFYNKEKSSIEYIFTTYSNDNLQESPDLEESFIIADSVHFYPTNTLKQLLTFSKFVGPADAPSLKNDCYIFDLESEKLAYIESFVCEPNISPDGKYLLYTNIETPDLAPIPMKRGIYIKNLENNTTVYYETSGDYDSHGVIEWVNKNKLMDLIQ